jgi:LPS sulfotransferase NodH
MKRFVILTTQRTGSTFLKNYLNSHPDILCYGELFNKPKYCVKVQPEQFYKRNYFNFFAKYKAAPYLNNILNGNKAVGFKLMYNQANELSLTPKKISEMGIQIIHLTRQNYLKIFISRQMKMLTGVAHSKKITNEFFKIKLNCKQMLKSIKQIHNDVEFYNKQINNRSFKITYEQLFNDTYGESKKILDYIEIAPNKQMRCELKKITSDNLSDIIENYDEVTEHLKNTPYEKFLW